MHKYLRAIGFGKLTDRKELQKLLTDIVVNGTDRAYTSNSENTLLAEFGKDFAEGIGIAVCGEFDEDDKFTYDYYYPYLRGNIISSQEDVTVERHAAQESYAGVCDDIKVGGFPDILSAEYDSLCKGTEFRYAAGSWNNTYPDCSIRKGTIMMPIMKTEKDLIRNKKTFQNRSQLINAARNGDEEAIESLTLDDMDTYTTISRRIQKEDVFSLVDTYFMPYGIECDQYSILAEIVECNQVTNHLTQEEIYVMTLNCNDLIFEMCINKEDLYGEPAVGRRFKGIIWMQGYINFPE